MNHSQLIMEALRVNPRNSFSEKKLYPHFLPHVFFLIFAPIFFSEKCCEGCAELFLSQTERKYHQLQVNNLFDLAQQLYRIFFYIWSSNEEKKGWKIVFDLIFSDEFLVNKSFFITKNVGELTTSGTSDNLSHIMLAGMTKKYRRVIS